MKTQALGAALLAATSLTLATPAQAQRIERIVTVGDSYADDGNAFQLGYANPQALGLYPSGRFSGGTNYIDTLSQILNAPVENFAIGGAFGGSNNGTLCFDPFYAPGTSPLCGKGLQYEIDQFLNVGVQSTAFPTGATTFGPNDLLTVSIGGNDARFYQQAGGVLATAPTAATAAAAGTSIQLDRLVAAGAPTISYLAGDTSLLPEIAGDAAAQAVRASYSATFNTAMQATLAGYADDGVVVHYLDLTKVLANIATDPAAYGLTSTGPCPVAQATQCVTNIAFRDQYLFYVDGLHLSSQGFKIVAQYVAAQLQAPLTLGAASELGLDVAHQWGRTMTARMDGGAPRDGGEATGMRFFLAGDTTARSTDAGPRSEDYRASSVGATAGVEFGFGVGSAGIAANWSKPKVNFGNDKADVEGRSIQLGAYAGAAVGPGFVQGYLGHGWDKHDLTRSGVVLAVEADPKGSHTVAGVKGGFLMPLGALRVGPVAGLEYAKAKVDGYTESGDPALDLSIDNVSFKRFRGSLGLELRGDFEGGGLQFRPYTAITAEKDFTGDERTVRFAQTAAPTIVNSFALEPASKKVYARVVGGFNAQIASAVSLNVAAGATVDKEQGNESNATLGLSIGF